jgi:hypothetical protein
MEVITAVVIDMMTEKVKWVELGVGTVWLLLLVARPWALLGSPIRRTWAHGELWREPAMWLILLSAVLITSRQLVPVHSAEWSVKSIGLPTLALVGHACWITLLGREIISLALDATIGKEAIQRRIGWSVGNRLVVVGFFLGLLLIFLVSPARSLFRFAASIATLGDGCCDTSAILDLVAYLETAFALRILVASFLVIVAGVRAGELVLRSRAVAALTLALMAVPLVLMVMQETPWHDAHLRWFLRDRPEVVMSLLPGLFAVVCLLWDSCFQGHARKQLP